MKEHAYFDDEYALVSPHDPETARFYYVAVVGSRKGVPESFVRLKLDRLLARMREANDPRSIVIISGGADGVDTFAHRWAMDHLAEGVTAMLYYADWSQGDHAGNLRNTSIVERAEIVVAFTTGTKGTADTIAKAQRAGKLGPVYRIGPAAETPSANPVPASPQLPLLPGL